jgi:hypothetical protein
MVSPRNDWGIKAMAQRYGRHLVNPVPSRSASRCFSQNLWNSTIAFQSSEPVVERNDEYGQYWLVACKINERFAASASPTGYEYGFVPRYFVVKPADGGLICSSSDAQISAACIAAVKAQRAEAIAC